MVQEAESEPKRRRKLKPRVIVMCRMVPESSLREFRKFSRGGKEKTANGIG
jgi:hypothetical protein